jgi:hypothetical protein
LIRTLSLKSLLLEIKDDGLNKIRDLFIVGLYTALRISDFSEIERLKIVSNNILIRSTVKNIAPVKTPIPKNKKCSYKKTQ